MAQSLLALLFVLAATQVPRAPFVATPPDVVDRMLALAGVTSNDVVYDLGCGDGRIVIAAAQKFGARGVGRRHRSGTGCRGASATRQRAKVEHLVTFKVEDALRHGRVWRDRRDAVPARVAKRRAQACIS